MVSYENLAVGEEYTINGILMDKATREPVLVDGSKVISTTTFTPKTKSGSVEIVFAFASTELQGKKMVAFESLVHEDEEIAVHADMNDAAQTVRVETPQSPGAKTGRDGLPYWLLIISVGAGVAAAWIGIKRKRLAKAEKER